jgi:hypothetical protein
VTVVTEPGTNNAAFIGILLTRGVRIDRDDDTVQRRQLVLLNP